MRYIQEAGNMLSTKEENVCEGIERLEDEIAELKEKLRAAVKQIQETEVVKILEGAPVNSAGCKIAAAVKDEYEPKDAKTLFGKLTDVPNVIAVVIYHSGERVNYMFGLGAGADGDCKTMIAKANELFGGRGGGKKESAQGGAPYADDWKEKAEKLIAALKAE